MVDLRTFDRTDDVSKLEGCNTRNVEYRWDLFSLELEMIPGGSETLDFGAGYRFSIRRCAASLETFSFIIAGWAKFRLQKALNDIKITVVL